MDTTAGRRVTVRRRDERGAAMVEFAMILPLLVLLTFGIIEFGVAFNASSSISQASRAGGRTAAIFSTDPQLEYNAALAAANALDVSPSSITGQPLICVSKFVAGGDPCSDQFSMQFNAEHFGGNGNPTWTINFTQPGGGVGVIPTANDQWPVAQRNFGCAPSNTFDRVVVRVQIQHDLLVPGLFSKFFGNKTSPTMTSDSVFQLEPVPTNQCAAS
jgi:Flp pilus assembly protein TadG